MVPDMFYRIRNPAKELNGVNHVFAVARDLM
jgi:hypothetical protein